MLVDTINKVKAISFDSSNLDAYVTSLRGLSATQAEVALSSAGLDKAQKQQILNKLAETNATISLTSAEATEALTRKLGSQDAAKELLIKSGLVTKEQLLAGATIEVTAAELEKAVVSGIITAQEKEQIVTALGLTGANIGLGTSFKLLATSIWASVKAMAAWLFTTPAGWATLAIGAIVGATAAYIKWGDTLENTREKLADLKSECDTITSNIESVNGEIETTKQRIAELENKGVLTFTEKEELDNLVKQNNELQRTIDLLKLKQNENQKEKNKTFVSAMEKDVEQYDEYHVSSRSGKVEKGHGGRDIGMGTTEKEYIKQQLKDYQENLRQISELNEQYKDDLSDKEYQKEKKRLEDKNKKIAEYIKDKNDEFATDAEGIDYIQNPTTEDDKKVNEWLDYINDFQDKMAVAMGGENAKENAFNRLVDNWKFDELLDPIQKLGKEGKVTLDVLKSKMSDPVFAEFVNKLVEIGVISDTTDGSLRYLANAFNGTATSARNYVTSLKGNELNNFIKNLGEEAKALGTTESELAKLTAAHVIFNKTGLSTEQQQQALQMLAAKIATTSAEMKYLLQLFNYASGNFDAAGASTMTEQERRARTVRSKQYLKDKYGIDLSPITIPEKEDANPYTPSGGGDDKGKDNTPDYEDPTEAIINRINLRANELEQQEEYIQNALEIAEIENDYEKQISLTNDLIATRKKRVEELNKANAELHNEAEYLRNSNPWNEDSWFNSQGEATEAYYNLYNSSSKADQEKIKNVFESISKIKEAWVKNDEAIVNLNKELLQDAGTLNDLYSTLHENKVRDIEHARDMALANDENTDVTPYYKQLQDEYHKEAERLRALDPEKYKSEIQELQIAWWDAEEAMVEARKEAMEKSIQDINDYIDARNTYNDWDAYGDSEVKAIQRITKIIEEEYEQRLISREEYIDQLEEQSQRIYQLGQDRVDKHLSDIDKYIDARNFYNDWDDFGDTEINAIEKQLRVLKNAYRLNLISYEEYTEKFAEYTQKLYSVAKDNIVEEVSKLIEDYEEMKNLESNQLESQKTLLQSYYDVTNSIAEAQHEINKELKASQSMYEYLNEETRELLFNQEDYNILNEELLEIQSAADELQKQYQEDILNASAETIAEITSQYQMQYETMMKQYEIAKAELEVAKKRQQLDNVLAERNTRMFINGQWQWVAKTQDVINAENELAEAEIERKKQEASLEQTESINKFTEQINSLETDLNIVRKYWADMQEMLNGESEEVAKALEEISQVSSPELKRVIEATGGSVSSFSGMLSESTETLSDIIDGDRGLGTMSTGIGTIITDLENYSDAIQALTAKISGAETSGGGSSSGDSTPSVSAIKAQMAANSAAWHTASESEKKKLEQENQKLGKSIGSTYNSATGTWTHKYASGTGYTAGGKTLLGEEGFEALITNDGRLIPINQPTIGNIGAGGVVFNREQMANLRTLWDWSNLGKISPIVSSSNSNSQSTVIDNSIHINGLTVGEQGNEDWINGFKRYVATHK